MSRYAIHPDRFDPAIHHTETNTTYGMLERRKEDYPRATPPRRTEDNHSTNAYRVRSRSRSRNRNHLPMPSLEKDIASVAANRTPLFDRREKIRQSIVRSPPLAMFLQSYRDQLLTSSYRFTHGDGKINPARYGSVLELDLGLCYTTFLTERPCEYGTACPYRHHPLTYEEIDWIASLGFRKFVDRAAQFWGSPEPAQPSFLLAAWMVGMKKELVGLGDAEGTERRCGDRKYTTAARDEISAEGQRYWRSPVEKARGRSRRHDYDDRKYDSYRPKFKDSDKDRYGKEKHRRDDEYEYGSESDRCTQRENHREHEGREKDKVKRYRDERSGYEDRPDRDEGRKRSRYN